MGNQCMCLRSGYLHHCLRDGTSPVLTDNSSKKSPWTLPYSTAKVYKGPPWNVVFCLKSITSNSNVVFSETTASPIYMTDCIIGQIRAASSNVWTIWIIFKSQLSMGEIIQTSLISSVNITLNPRKSHHFPISRCPTVGVPLNQAF